MWHILKDHSITYFHLFGKQEYTETRSYSWDFLKMTFPTNLELRVYADKNRQHPEWQERDKMKRRTPREYRGDAAVTWDFAIEVRQIYYSIQYSTIHLSDESTYEKDRERQEGPGINPYKKSSPTFVNSPIGIFFLSFTIVSTVLKYQHYDKVYHSFQTHYQ